MPVARRTPAARPSCPLGLPGQPVVTGGPEGL